MRKSINYPETTEELMAAISASGCTVKVAGDSCLTDVLIADDGLPISRSDKYTLQCGAFKLSFYDKDEHKRMLLSDVFGSKELYYTANMSVGTGCTSLIEPIKREAKVDAIRDIKDIAEGEMHINDRAVVDVSDQDGNIVYGAEFIGTQWRKWDKEDIKRANDVRRYQRS